MTDITMPIASSSKRLPERSICNILMTYPESGRRLDSDPVIYKPSEKFSFNHDVLQDEQMITFNFDGYFTGVRVQTLMGSDSMRKIRHDFVANLCGDETDVFLSEIDPDYDEKTNKQEYHGMSPDFWYEPRRAIMELGTTLATTEESILADYRTKLYKYKPYLELCQIQDYIVLIVSPTMVCSNAALPQMFVDEVCARVRAGVSMEVEIVEVLGFDVYMDKSDNSRIDIVKTNLYLMKPDMTIEKDFNPEEMLELARAEMDEASKMRVNRIIKHELNKLNTIMPEPRTVLEKYINGFNRDECRKINDRKRICNFPIINCKRVNVRDMCPLKPLDKLPGEIPIELSKVWNACFATQQYVPKKFNEESHPELRDYGLKEYNKVKHANKRAHLFEPSLDQIDVLELAKKGLFAKNLSELLREKTEEGHMSFHPDAETTDIEEFLKSDIFTGQSEYEQDAVMELLKESKRYAHDVDPILSSTEFFEKFLLQSEFVQYMDFISSAMIELSYGIKHYTPGKKFLFKYLRQHRAGFIMHNTGTHVFVSYCFEKCYYNTPCDPGRIGPEIFDLGSYWVSDFCSYTPEIVENFVKAGPYAASWMTHLLSSFQVPIHDITEDQFYGTKFIPDFWQTAKTIMLIYLNGKLDVEELVTAQRFFYMNILDDLMPNPYKFTERLPGVLRSRLTSYLLTKTISNMDFYSKERIGKIFHKTNAGDESVTYTGIRSLFCQSPITIEHLIDTFYYGYVVTKNRMGGAHNSFAICKKLISEELKYLKNRNSGKEVFGLLSEPEAHRTDKDVFKFFLNYFHSICKRSMGCNFKAVLKRDILREMAGKLFSDLATLKASGREHNNTSYMEMEQGFDGKSSREIQKEMRKSNKEEFERRPKALEAMTSLCDEYTSKHGALDHIIQLVPYCMSELNKKKRIDSDLFSKSQHGGFREIHVMEIKARVIQFFVELISREICSKFSSETITHPETKDRFVPNHYKKANVSFDEFVTICRSADAKTWCQNHFTTRFCVMLLSLTDPIFHGLILGVFRLWVNKTVTLPNELISTFLANAKTATGDEMFSEMRHRFYHGIEPFSGPMSSKVIIRSGMWQGIMHYSSSLFHTMVQEVMNSLLPVMVKTLLKVDSVCDVEQGSDDSGIMISVNVKGKNQKKIVASVCKLIRLKDGIAKWVGIIPSEAKTAQSLISLYEYNSEWFLRSKICKPTFRWVSACFELTVTENFVTRFRIFSNVLTQTLEGGASTFECSLIQLSQAWFHYKLVGLDNHHNFKELKDRLIEFPDPASGMFPLDHDLLSGVAGYDYAVYKVAIKNKHGSRIICLEDLCETERLEIEGVKSNAMTRSTKQFGISFSSTKKFDSIAKNVNVPTLEKCLEILEENPELLFSKHSTWSEDKISVALKLYSPGVKASLSEHASVLRMVVASAYMLNTACFWEKGTKGKFTLFELIDRKMSIVLSDERNSESIDLMFPMKASYDELTNFINEVSKKMMLSTETFTKKSKISIEVFSNVIDDEHPILDMCKRKWFGNKRAVKTGTTHFNNLWERACLKYKFLRDTREETQEVTGLNIIQLKHFIESIVGKTRKIKLADTTARNNSIYHTITRIFWKNVKIRYAAELDSILSDDTLRSSLFSMMNFIYSDAHLTSEVSRLISTDKSLINNSFEILPPRSRNLKIMNSFLTRSEKPDDIVSQIISTKRGAIGFFNMRQKMIDRKRVGRGEWVGLVGVTSVKISIFENTVMMVTISGLTELDYISHYVRDLIKEFHLEFPKDAILSDSGIYLTTRGEFKKKGHEHGSFCPVEIDNSFRMRYFEKVNFNDWSFEVNKFTLRIVCNFTEFGKMTILSEKISVRDWSPDLEVLGSGKYLQLFHKSKPMSMADWEEFCGEILDITPIKALKRRRIAGIYDTRKLLDLIATHWFQRSDPRDTITSLVRYNKIESEISEEEPPAMMPEFIAEWIKGQIELGDTDFSVEDSIDWSEEMQNDNKFGDEFGFAPNDEDDRLMEEAVRDILDMEIFLEEKMEIMDLASYGMPRANNFLRGLNETIAISHPTLEFKRVLSNDTELHLDKVTKTVLSIALGEELIGLNKTTFYSKALLEVPAPSREESEGTFAKSNYSVTKLVTGIEELRKAIAINEGYARDLLVRELEKMEKQLLLKDPSISKKTDDFSRIPAVPFMIGFVDTYNQFDDGDDFPEECTDLSLTEEERAAHFKKYLTHVIDSMAESVKPHMRFTIDNYRSSLLYPFVTEQLVDLISVSTQTCIEVRIMDISLGCFINNHESGTPKFIITYDPDGQVSSEFEL